MYKVIGVRKTRTFRVLWMLEELGQAYEHVPVTPASAEARQYNPSGKIPSMIVDGAVLTDSTAIMTYLADTHGSLTAKPGTRDRAEQDAVTHWLLDDLDAVLWANAKYVTLYPDEMRVPAIAPVLASEFGRNLKRLEKRLGDKPFLMGKSISLPDILAVHCLGWGMVNGFPRPSEAVLSYFRRLSDRPAYVRASALP